MDAVDRTLIPEIHAAARRHRAVYLSCLFKSFRNWVAGAKRVSCGEVRA